MAIGYHKLNTSGARTKRHNQVCNRKLTDDMLKFQIIKPSVDVFHDTFGRGVTITGATGANDNVRVDFESCGIKVIKCSYINKIN